MYDCIVIGAGPAGSTTAALVAQAGYRTLLLDRRQAARPRVAAALLPECHATLARLGVLERLRQGRHPRIRGVRLAGPDGRPWAAFDFVEHDPRPATLACTWRIKRSELDRLLRDNAAERGAECRRAVEAVDVLVDGDRAYGVRVRGAAESADAADFPPWRDDAAEVLRCRVIVDATGGALLSEKLDLLGPPSRRPRAAIWGCYRNARRDREHHHPAGDRADATHVLRTQGGRSWFWYAPLADAVGVGVVADNDYLLAGRGTPGSVFEEELVRCPAVVDRLIDAELVSTIHVAEEPSWTARRTSGEGWVVLGEGEEAIDPIGSSGVYLAVRAAELAADAIVEGFDRDDLSAGQLGRWTPEFLAGGRAMRRLADLLYAPEVRLAAFLRDYPHHRASLTEILMGRVFRSAAEDVFEVFDDWDAWASGPSQVGSPP